MNPQRHWRWLQANLPGWVERGILTTAQAERLLAEQPAGSTGHSLLTRILIGFSALLLGLGVISFFAFNWQAMPRGLKLLVIFGAFAGAHGAGLLPVFRSHSRRHLPEFFHLLGTLFFGAAIALIAQVYHIDEHPPNGVLLWAAGALLMAWVLNSTPQLLVGGILTVVWQLMQRESGTAQPWLVLGFAAILVPFAVRKRDGFTSVVVTLALLSVALTQFTYLRSALLAGPFFFGALLFGAGRLARVAGQPSCARAPEIVGGALYYGLVVIFTFSEPIRDGLIRFREGSGAVEWVFPAAMALAALVAWGAWMWMPAARSDRRRQPLQRHLLLVPVGLLAGLALWTWGRVVAPGPGLRSQAAAIGMVFFILLAVAHGLAMISAGSRSGRVGIAFVGCLLLVTVILARFLSTVDDLLLRSAAFIAAGAFMLFIAMRTSRARKDPHRPKLTGPVPAGTSEPGENGSGPGIGGPPS